MSSSAITNSLLRLDGVSGSPPSPFERPNNKMDFFVLELGLHKNIEDWCAHTAKTLTVHRQLLQEMRGSGATATLFVESELRELRFESSFLRILAEAGIALEFYHANA